VRGHDLPIYLSVLYSFLLILLFQYRNLCHEWTTWTSKVPALKADDVNVWYKSKVAKDVEEGDEDLSGDALSKVATAAFQEAVYSFLRKQTMGLNRSEDALVAKAAEGLPFALWLLEKESPSPEKKTKKKFGNDSDLFTKIWLSKVEQSLKNTQQLAQGLKEHSIFVLFRYGKYDVSSTIHSICLSTRLIIPPR